MGKMVSFGPLFAQHDSRHITIWTKWTTFYYINQIKEKQIVYRILRSIVYRK